MSDILAETKTVAGFRFSPQQERVWPVGGNAVLMARIDGPCAPDDLRRTLRGMIARHEILRTVYRRQPGMKLPFQVILDEDELDPIWETVDLREMDNAARTTDLERLFQREQQREFQLADGPVLSCIFAKAGTGTSYLILCAPALSADGRSLRNLVTGMAIARLEAEVMQYADFVEWQNELLLGDDTRQGRDFWRDHCRKIDLAALDSAPLPFEMAKIHAPFSPDTVPLAISSDSLPPELLLACWDQLLLRLTGSAENVIGCNFEGRKYEELEAALGHFSKYLPLALSHDEDSDTSVHAAAIQARDALLEAAKWQESFAWSSLDSPTLPVLFEQATLPELEIAGVKWRALREDVGGERYKLKLKAISLADGLRLELHYDRACFTRESAARLARYYEVLLEAATAAAPEMRFSELPLLPPQERERLLAEPAPRDYPPCCIHELFEQQAERTPQRLAVRCEAQALTYAELNERSNRLAHYLRNAGVGPDSLVGLCLDRSVEMMVAVLGIMKAGGAYVPLLADQPPKRLQQQLTGVTVLLTEQKFARQIPPFSGATLLLDQLDQINQKDAQWTRESPENPPPLSTPENLAYVIYTSGSTGVPKGVAVRQRNLVNYAWHIAQELQLASDPGGLNCATVSTLGADLGNTCIYPALISGGCVHVLPYEVATDTQRMAIYQRQWPIDVLKIVPSHLSALLNPSDGPAVLPRKYLILGGETLKPELVEKIEASGARCEIINHYGPTETTVGSLMMRIEDYPWSQSAAASVPIGRPLANTRAYILDAQRQLLPQGSAGELYISGAGVAAGYLRDPQRTAERFLPDPFHAGETMYRTGDLARYLPDGTFEFLGRADDQVKVRGFRVELGEIEAALLRQPGVKQAIVLARGEEAQLLGYVVASREFNVIAEDLRQKLKQELPDYMVPAVITMLDKLPLTANGKVDRKALPQAGAAQTRTYTAARTATEDLVAQIWAEVLKLDQVGREDDFFQLGGHSLLATQVVSRIRRALQLELPLRTLFEAPTVARLAEQIERARRAQVGLQMPPMARVSRERPLALSFAQQRLWILDQMEPNNALYNVPRRMRLKGPLNLEALQRSLNEMVRRHESLRTTFTLIDRQPAQVIAANHAFAIDMVEAGEAEALRIATEESLRPFDLTQGPLLRMKILKLAPDDHLLLLTMHHIVSDAWSAGVFAEELSAIYQAFVLGAPSPLPDPVLQYADYAAWQREYLQGETLRAQLAFWGEQLQGAAPLLQLPADRARPQAQTFAGAHQSFSIAAELTAALNALARQEGVTLFMVLLAAFAVQLGRYTGEEQMVIGTDAANRPTVEAERMIGFFINLLPLRQDLSGNPTFKELLGRTRERTLAAYTHQEMPFEKIVEELRPERSLSHNPIVQVLFVMQNTPSAGRRMGDLEVSGFDVPLTRSKFDAAVFLAESKDRGLQCHWVYSTDLFDRSSIERMQAHYETLLSNAVRQPEMRVSALEMLSAEEKERQSAEQAARKKAQRKKLMKSEPKTVNISMGKGAGEQ